MLRVPSLSIGHRWHNTKEILGKNTQYCLKYKEQDAMVKQGDSFCRQATLGEFPKLIVNTHALHASEWWDHNVRLLKLKLS